MLTLYILLALLILQGLFSLIEGLKFRRFVLRSLHSVLNPFTPKVALIIPCKGAEPDLDRNLRALFRQDYPNYEIIFAIATANDTARPIIERAISENPDRTTRLVIAGESDQRSEKVNNLLHAVRAAGDDCEAYAFTDSDAEADPDWLRSLTSGLSEPAVGACTGYRWYLPKSGGFWSALVSAWNGSIATSLGDNHRNFAWGGSTAILKEVFVRADVAEFWDKALSDDYALTSALGHAGYRISFAPRCLMTSRADFKLARLLEFTTRQVIITRIYRPKLWWTAFISHLLFCVVFSSGLGIAIYSGISGVYSSMLLILLGLIYLLGSAKGALRIIAVRAALKAHRDDITRLWWMFCLLWPLTSVLFLYNFFGSALTNQITWRGVSYELRSRTDTVVINRDH